MNLNGVTNGTAQPTQPPEPTAPGEHEPSLEALTAYIVATVNGKSPMRFHEAAKLCGVANVILQMRAERVADYGTGNGNGGVGFGLYDAAPPMIWNNGGARNHIQQIGVAGSVDQAEITRNVLQAVIPGMQVQTEASKSTIAKNEADELETLQRLADGAARSGERRAELEKRIEQLFTNMKTRNHAKEIAEPVNASGAQSAARAVAPHTVVPADVPR